MRIAHVITGLGNGGAEGVLHRLVTHDIRNTHFVISLQDAGLYGERLVRQGISLYTLDMPRGRLQWKGVAKLFSIYRIIKPDVVQTWMYHADLLGGMVAKLLGIKAIIWGIRGAYDKNNTSIKTKLTIYACSRLSKWIPSKIVSNSEHAKQAHEHIGYTKKKIMVIPNGFSFVKFKPDDKAKNEICSWFKLSPNDILLGMVARFDAYKDHENLFRALARLLKMTQQFKCLLIGPGMESANKALVNMIQHYELQDIVILCGPQEEVYKFMAALDVHVLSSLGESFPNVLAEAMACGVPCVTTNVGDAASIVNDTGWIVPPSNPNALAAALNEAINERHTFSGWESRQQACIQRVNSQFNLTRMIENYNALWKSIKD
jgi:glycosyltransferase involved in cell wall biosynthesis